jgi:CMP/dCMP kinase
VTQETKDRFVVTIDGPAASGKSTVARLVAQRIGATFLDTGAMYRAVTWAAQQDGVDWQDESQLVRAIEDHTFVFDPTADGLAVAVDGVDITQAIRSPELTANVRFVAASPATRSRLVELQRQFAMRHRRVVTEGRDQGTVAFADAEVKFFLEADAAERARRRQGDLAARGIESDLQELTEAIESRDRSDRERAVGPLRAAEDAICVDTTKRTIDEVVERLLRSIKERQEAESR